MAVNALWGNIFNKNRKNSDDPLAILGEIPIFHELKKGEIKEIERIVHVREYATDEYIFQQGDVGAGMYVIAKGSVAIVIEEPKEAVLATLDKESFFGELSLIDDERRSASAKATEPSTLIGLFRPDLLDLIERNPSLGSKVLTNVARILGERLRAMNERLTSLTADTADEK